MSFFKDESEGSDNRLHAREIPIQATGAGSAPPGLVGLYNLWNRTVGSLTIDLRRPIPRPTRSLLYYPADRQDYQYSTPQATRGYTPSRFRRENEAAPPRGGIFHSIFGTPPLGGPGIYGTPPPRQRRARNAQQSVASRGSIMQDVAFGDSGARVKLMRHVRFGPEQEIQKLYEPFPRKRPAFDVGGGLNFDLDTARLQPLLRLKYRDLISFKLLPEPGIKLEKFFFLGDSNLGVRLKYECPVEGLTNFWRPPARFLLTIDNTVHKGVRLTQSGVEFDGALSALEGSVRVRGQALLALPRELPVEEGQPLVGLDVNRLGIKTVW